MYTCASVTDVKTKTKLRLKQVREMPIPTYKIITKRVLNKKFKHFRFRTNP